MPALLALLAVVTLLLGQMGSRSPAELRIFQEKTVPPQRRWAGFFLSWLVHATFAMFIFTIAKYLFPVRQEQWLQQHFSRKPLIIQVQPEPLKIRVEQAEQRIPPKTPPAKPVKRIAKAPAPKPAAVPEPMAKALTKLKPFIPPPPPPPAKAEVPRVASPPSLLAAAPEVAKLRLPIVPPESITLNENFDRMMAKDAVAQQEAAEALHSQMFSNAQQTLLRFYTALMSPDQWLNRNLEGFRDGDRKAPIAELADREQAGTGLKAYPLVREVHPNNGAFDVVVTQSSVDGDFVTLSGQPTYMVYLPVGEAKQWILQFCLPRNSSKGVEVSETVVQLPNPAPVKGPYPLVTVRPPIRLEEGIPYLIVHGYVDKKGRMKELKVLRGAGPLYSELILASLAQWEFRPATQDGQPVLVEVLLSIPPDRA